jgi:single-strand DNA-binding protein
MSVNKVIILGFLGQDPELKHLPNGTPVVNVSVATTKTWNDKTTKEKKSETEWHRIVMFGKRAEIVNQYLSKGSQAYFEGELRTRSWEDSEGNKRYSTEIIADTFSFVGGNSGEKKEAPLKANAQDYTKSEANFAADSIPF